MIKMPPAIRCICGHLKGTHIQKFKQKDTIVFNKWSGECILNSCNCKKFKEVIEHSREQNEKIP